MMWPGLSRPRITFFGRKGSVPLPIQARRVLQTYLESRPTVPVTASERITSQPGVGQKKRRWGLGMGMSAAYFAVRQCQLELRNTDARDLSTVNGYGKADTGVRRNGRMAASVNGKASRHSEPDAAPVNQINGAAKNGKRELATA